MRSCLIGLSVVVILTVVWTPSSSSQTCGGVVNGTQKEGEITSPTFPSPNITCTWYLIKTDMPYAIITVKDLKLQGYKASLIIYSGNATADGAKAELVGNFSQNSEVRPMVMSDNVTTIVLFTGDWPLNNRTAAFSLHYRIANDCRTERTISSTRIQSPLFSSGCLPLSCSYSLEGRNSEKNFTLSFSEFEMPKGRVTVKNENNTLAILSGSSIPEDIFTKGDNLLIEFTTNSTDNEGFTAVVNTIEPDCLLNISLTDLGRSVPLTLPSDVESPVSCQYVITSPENSTVLVSTNPKSLLTARVVVSDGWSLFGGQRRGNLGSKDTGLSFVSTGPVLSLYLSLDPSLSLSQDPVLISATAQAYGGVFTNNGSLEGRWGNSPGSSPTLYYLTVPEHQKVRFEITDSLLFPASSIRCYDGLTELNPLLTEFRSDIPLYPVVSTGSQMLVVASDLNYRGFFTAEFSGITEDCDTVSSGAQGQYERQVTPGTEVKVCSWVIRPLNEDGVFLLRSSVSGFESGDNLTVFDGQSDYSQNVLRVSGHEPSQFVSLPVVASSARTGARLQFNLAAMNESINSTATSRIVKADYSFSPGRFCGASIDPDSEGNLLSPFFPNERYPLNLRCVWNSSVPENKTFYMTFDTFDLDPQHSISVMEYVNETEELGDNCTESFNGSVVPSDVLLRGPYVNIVFSSEKSHQGGNSGSGFNITYRTIEFGDILTNNSGTISTPDFPRSVSATIECIWIISLPFKAKSSGDVPIAKFDLDLENYSQMSSNNVLEFRDGNSQNAPLIDLKPANGKTTGLYSRTNQLWVRYVYKLHDQRSNSPGFAFRLQYTTYECPKTQQCDNGVCMQASWKCNGIDECGDDTDEKNCINKSKGVAGFVVAILVIMGFCLGVLAALIAPSVYKRIRYPNYRHLREAVSPIDT